MSTKVGFAFIPRAKARGFSRSPSDKNPYNDNERRYMGFDVCEKKGVSGRLSVDQIMPHTDTKV